MLGAISGHDAESNNDTHKHRRMAFCSCFALPLSRSRAYTAPFKTPFASLKITTYAACKHIIDVKNIQKCCLRTSKKNGHIECGRSQFRIFCQTKMLLSPHGVRSKSYLCFVFVVSIITIFGNQQFKLQTFTYCSLLDSHIKLL